MSELAPVVLVHAGICDNRMWDGFEPLLGGERRVVRHEMRGFGDTPLPAAGQFSHADDLQAALDAPAVLVGASFGGQVCLELAARRPDLVAALVLLDAALPDHQWSNEIEEYAAEEERLLEAGDLDAVAELNVLFWAPQVRESVRAMQRQALELQSGSESEEKAPDTIDLGAIRAPTLVARGEDDKDDFKRIADRLASEIAGAREATVEGAGHLPALEQPEATARLVLDFLDFWRGGPFVKP